MKIVLFNGPPYSGKDTVARMLANHMDSRVTIPVKEDSLSLPLRHIAYSIVGRTYHESGPLPDGDPTYSEFKKERFDIGEGIVTGRQLMIDASESFLKVCYGQRVMADLLLVRNQDFDGLLLIRDCGFQVEIDPLVEYAGLENVYLCQVRRPGASFDNDSREWVNLIPKQTTIIDNSQDLDHLHTEAIRVYGRLVNQMGWAL